MTVAHKTKKKRKIPSANAAKPAAPLGRYLRKFTLQNVRTFRSPVTLDFCHPDGSVAQWTVILGENGTGKTTLLQYLAGMIPTDRREWPPPSLGYNSVEIRSAPRLANESWYLWHVQNLAGDVTKNIIINAELQFSVLASRLNDSILETNDPSIALFLEFSHPEPDPSSGIWEVRSTDFTKQFHLVAYGANRHIAGPASPYLSSQTFFRDGGNDPISTLYHDDHPLISPEQWLLGLHHTSRSGGDPAKHAGRALASAQRCFVNTLPDVHAFTVKAQPTAHGQSLMTVMCQTPFGEVPFNALSVGYRTMAAWLTDFVKRMHEAFPDLDEPDNGPAVVLIDEFDLHMHPKWQREAMAALSKEFPNTQFIVTAHSPIIVQATEGNAKLIVLRRFQREDGTEEVLVDDHPRYAAGWRVDQILSSDLYNLDPRSPKYDALMEESIRLRQKERRTAKEEKRLSEIEAELEREAPPGTSSASRQLFADLEQALQKAHTNGK